MTISTLIKFDLFKLKDFEFNCVEKNRFIAK